MKTQSRRYYHLGDGVIREVITSEASSRKEKLKNKRLKNNENESKKDR